MENRMDLFQTGFGSLQWIELVLKSPRSINRAEDIRADKVANLYQKG